jgi:hypothetical protein
MPCNKVGLLWVSLPDVKESQLAENATEFDVSTKTSVGMS